MIGQDGRTQMSAFPQGQSPRADRRWARTLLVEALPAPVSPLCETLVLPLVAVGVRGCVFRLTRDDAARYLFEDPAFTTINGWAFCADDLRLTPGLVSAAVLRFPRYGRLLDVLLREVMAACCEVSAAIDRRDVTGRCGADLLGLIEQAALAGARQWAAAAAALWYADVWERLLQAFLRVAVGPDAPAACRLVAGLPEIAETLLAPLARLTRELAADPHARAARAPVMPCQVPEILATLPGGARRHAQVERLIFTHRTLVRSLDFALPLLGDDPCPVYEVLAQAMSAGGSAALARRTAPALARAGAIARVEAGFDPIRRLLFRRLRARARAGPARRPQALRPLGRAWPGMRRCVLELGRRLASAGMVEQPDDAFYLTWVELQQVCRSLPAGVPADLRARVKQRRAERHAWAAAVPPEHVPEHYSQPHWAGRGRMLAGVLADKVSALTGRSTQDASTGVVLSSGTATGPAFVAKTLEELKGVPAGSVLITRELAPAYWPLLVLCSALVLEARAERAHSAYVARDLGIPAIAGVAGITTRVQPGQIVAVDGERGVVRTA